MGNSESGQLTMGMGGGCGSLEFSEIRDHVKIKRWPRKSQHCSGKTGHSAIV